MAFRARSLLTCSIVTCSIVTRGVATRGLILVALGVAACGSESNKTDSNSAAAGGPSAAPGDSSTPAAPGGALPAPVPGGSGLPVGDEPGIIGEGDADDPGPMPSDFPIDEDSACADSNTYIGRSTPAALELLVDTSCSMSQAPAGTNPNPGFPGMMGGGMMGGGMMGGGEVLTGPSECPTEIREIMPFTCNIGGGGDGSKWQITRDALLDAIAEFSESTWLGLMFYPYPPTAPAEQMHAGNQCECYPDATFFIPENTVPAAALTADQSMRVVAALGDAVVNGSTPTHAAYRSAVEYLRAAAFTGDKFVVLITDGDPTYGLTAEGGCYGDGLNRVDSTSLIADVTAARTSGIFTYVIGSPGSENARVDLSRMAEEGGTAREGCSSAADSDLFCHLDMTTEPDFTAALAGALGQVVEQTSDPCTYAVPMPEGGEMLDRGRVNVSYTDETGVKVEIGKDPSETECNSGWQYSADQNNIVLCPDVCATITASGNTDVDILVGCKTNLGGGAR